MLDYRATGVDGETATWQRERARLVKLCARLTGDAAVAEDLAQEALLEGWRHQRNLRDPDRFSAWLAGIARNVSLRWIRQHSHVAAHTASLPFDDDDEPVDALDQLEDALGVEIELERKELAALLDQALALLPDETRVAFLAHVVEGVPVAQISARMGVNASAVTMRLQRGKVILRRALTNELGRELADYAPSTAAAGIWEDTPLWCTLCGKSRLRGRYARAEGELRLWCPICCISPRDYISSTNSLQILGGVKGYKRAHNRLFAWIDRYYPPALRTWSVACMHCGRANALQVGLPSALVESLEDRYKLYHVCPSCDKASWVSLDGLLLAKPDGIAFQAQHPRIRTLPLYEVEAEGRQAVVARFESVTSQDRLVMTVDAETCELLRVDGGSL